jgi:hypothetical protein
MIEPGRNEEIKKTIQKRVFLVGCPRSGTTLLQSLLAANSQVSSFPESHFFEKLFSGWRLLYLCGIASRGAKPRWKLRQYVRSFVYIFDKITLEYGRTFWLEKTPGHVQHVREIEQLVPSAKFVHILRNGADNIASMYEVAQRYPESWSKWYGTLDQCIARWIKDARISRACDGLENHRVIEYNRLVESSEEVLRELCQFIGLTFEPGMLENYTSSAAQLILKKEKWKSAVYETIQKISLSKFDTFLDSWQREYILAHIPADLKSMVKVDPKQEGRP